MELIELLKKAFALGGSDIFIVPGAPVTAKVKGDFTPLTDGRMKPSDTVQLVATARYQAGERIRDGCVEHIQSIYSTITDEEGFHIRREDLPRYLFSSVCFLYTSIFFTVK